MSRYVNLDQIIADIYEKWGCDPAYYVGVSGADAYQAKLDADLIEFLQSKPSIDIRRCKDCRYWVAWEGCKCPCGLRSTSDNCFCSFAMRRRKPNE